MSTSTCLNCGRSEQEIPLLAVKFQEKDFHICPQCLPILIHHPDRLTDKLPGYQPAEFPPGLAD
jgi:hypothetical protein